VPISTGAVDFAMQGNLNLMAIATSASDPAIQGAASADVAIPATTGMTAEFSPASQTLASPGKVTFLLMVYNTGNTEDSYSATITGVSGPVTATLVGLNGSPTQSISTFILPGLSTGAIELQVDLSGVGQGAITVQVKSLTNAEIASPVAMTIVTPAAVV
jgi:large repetitive protein